MRPLTRPEQDIRMRNNLPRREASLFRFWERITNDHNKGRSTVAPDDWNEEVFYLSAYGLGIEEVLVFLYNKRPSFEGFLAWLQEAAIRAEDEQYEHNEPILTAEDKAFWNKNGYLVIKNAVPVEQCTEARAAIWEYLGADPTQPDTWYRNHPGKNGLMLRFSQHSILDKNRRAARIRKAYEELYNSTEIYLLLDKVSFNPPETDQYSFLGSPLHWDVSLQQPVPFVLQGLLYLNNVGEHDGAFHCVPGFHHEIGNWLASLPSGTNPREAAKQELTPIPVPANAGDLIIWHQALPHCATANKGTNPRMVQYITYQPLKMQTQEIWI